jgi:hypothetical protein
MFDDINENEIKNQYNLDEQNQKLIQEMFDEIDNMTKEEYWKLYEESRSLPDFDPEKKIEFFPMF